MAATVYCGDSKPMVEKDPVTPTGHREYVLIEALDIDLSDVKAVLDAIKGKTDNIPASPATEGGNLAAILAILGAATPSGENHIGAVGGHTARVNASFTRPADTTAYAVGDLVANNTVAGSVTPMSFALSRATGKGGMIRRVRLRKSGTTITNAQFRLHLYSVSPACTNGDNGAWLTDNAANYIGGFDVTIDKAFSDGAAGNGVPLIGSEVNFTSDTVFGVTEARAAYAPGNAEQLTWEIEVLQN